MLEIKHANVEATNWIAYTPTFGAMTSLTVSGTAPTAGTLSRNLWLYRRVGKILYINACLRQTAAGSDGSGVYTVSIPNGFTLDTSIALPPSWLDLEAQTQTGYSPDGVPFGTGLVHGSGETVPMPLTVMALTSTTFVLAYSVSTPADTVYKRYWCSTAAGFGDDAMCLTVQAQLPITL